MYQGNKTSRHTTRMRPIFSVLSLICAAAICALAQNAPSALAQEPSERVLGVEELALKQALDGTFEANVPAFYEALGYRQIWSDARGEASEAASALVSALETAERHALPAWSYERDALARLMASDADPLAREMAFTKAYLAYADDLSAGVLNPRTVDREIHAVPRRRTVDTLLSEMAWSKDPAATLANLVPAAREYQTLLDLHDTFVNDMSDEAWGEPVAAGRSLRPGMRSERVALLRDRLIAMGDLNPLEYLQAADAGQSDGTQLATREMQTDVPLSGPEDPVVYDPVLVAAVKRFQARHGLNEDGIVGPATRRQLNASPRERAEQIAVSLERLRWLNHDLGQRHIRVNLADFTMAVVEDGAPVFTSRVVVGQSRDHRTPEFSDFMTHMVINPTWNVPRSIATEEILPLLQEDPNYLVAHNMRLIGADDTLIDWTTVTPETFPGRIAQDPGPGNALGTVKFMFPNDFAIYLHDTPSKRFFAHDVRDYSHGCVRVERPHALAALLLAPQRSDPAGYFSTILEAQKERWVNLKTPLPVHLTYLTAWVDSTGRPQFRGDIYKRDRQIATALREAGVTLAN